MFPSPKDIAAHRASAARRRTLKAALEARIAEVRDPATLTDLLLIEAGRIYRQGHRTVEFTLEIPAANFIDWARSRKIIGPTPHNDDRNAIRSSLARVVKKSIKEQLVSGAFLDFNASHATNQRLSFKVRINVIAPK